jgi:FO synthase
VLARTTEEHGQVLVERLAIYPEYALTPEVWVDPQLAPAVIRAIDIDGLARTDPWSPGAVEAIPAGYRRPLPAGQPPAVLQSEALHRILDHALAGRDLGHDEVVRLFAARGSEFEAVCQAADQLRRDVNGETVTYVVNRNIQYTNICSYRCQFCAFSKGKLAENLRGLPYLLPIEEVVRRAREAWDRGATEVCMQGGIHPEYTGETYLEICRVVHEAVPGMHVHAFSPLEIWQGAATLGIPVREFLIRLRDAGLGTLPGTAAEILDDTVRRIICPDKITTGQWLTVMEEAHHLRFQTTSTIMYGHLEQPISWARHLLALRGLQQRTGGFTEFVPLPFVAMEAPMFLKGKARRGPTFREAVLMHAVARLVLHPHIPNIQVSWVKMGPEGAAICLQSGANDLGGTLMNESISRAAGASHGQELPPAAMEDLIRSIGRVPRQRSTTYGEVSDERRVTSFQAAPLAPLLQPISSRYSRQTAQAAIEGRGN